MMIGKIVNVIVSTSHKFSHFPKITFSGNTSYVLIQKIREYTVVTGGSI
jgi:hypothetical protein